MTESGEYAGHNGRRGKESRALAGKQAWSRHGKQHHGVQFCSEEKFLLNELIQYIGDALRAGDAKLITESEGLVDHLAESCRCQLLRTVHGL